MTDRPQPLLARALEAAANAVMIADRDGRIVWVNDAFCRLSGYGRDEVIGRTPGLLKSGKQSPDFYRDLWETIASGRTWQGELVERRRDGSLWTANQVITPLLDESGRVTHFVAIQHDVTAITREREEIQRLAYHDSLTGLPNRASFLESLERGIARAAPDQRLIALLFLDLDDFKPINDALGHAAGDELLVAVAERLRAAVRKTDAVARLGGDEFAVLLTDVEHPDTAGALAGKLVDRIGQPYMLSGRRIEVGVSIGISVYPRDGATVDTLLSHADAAMYAAKARGRRQYRFFDARQAGAPPARSPRGAG
ncbi:MAG TPA: diguanylate cyclase [Burkholderiales bacterium]|nr:diguanylate cyclase [Burkholderiales bacterium]